MTVGPGYGGAGVARTQMRASTVDRDRAVELVTRAYTEGRLTKDEHDARVERAMTAGTFAELDAVVIDLSGGGPPAPPVLAKTNPLAITSLTCGVAQLMFGPFATVPAVVCGHIARGQIRKTGQSGAGMALAGLILGWVGAAFEVLVVIWIVWLFVAFGLASNAGAG